jgi:hypothetical protein
MRKSRPLTGLLALNAVLLAVLAVVSLAPRVQASAAPRSTFTMVAGSVKGQTMPVVYIVDETAMELVGISWDEQQKTMNGMGYRNLANDMNEIARVRN